MEKFIEVQTTDGKLLSINVKHIVSVERMGAGAKIEMVKLNRITNLTYEGVMKLITT